MIASTAGQDESVKMEQAQTVTDEGSQVRATEPATAMEAVAKTTELTATEAAADVQATDAEKEDDFKRLETIA